MIAAGLSLSALPRSRAADWVYRRDVSLCVMVPIQIWAGSLSRQRPVDTRTTYPEHPCNLCRSFTIRLHGLNCGPVNGRLAAFICPIGFGPFDTFELTFLTDVGFKCATADGENKASFPCLRKRQFSALFDVKQCKFAAC